MKYRCGAVAVLRDTSNRLAPLLDHLAELLRLVVSERPLPHGPPTASCESVEISDAAVSMAALNCSASRLGLSKTEVDVMRGHSLPHGLGPRHQAKRDRSGKRSVSQLTDAVLLWDYETEAFSFRDH